MDEWFDSDKIHFVTEDVQVYKPQSSSLASRYSVARSIEYPCPFFALAPEENSWCNRRNYSLKSIKVHLKQVHDTIYQEKLLTLEGIMKHCRNCLSTQCYRSKSGKQKTIQGKHRESTTTHLENSVPHPQNQEYTPLIPYPKKATGRHTHQFTPKKPSNTSRLPNQKQEFLIFPQTLGSNLDGRAFDLYSPQISAKSQSSEFGHGLGNFNDLSTLYPLPELDHQEIVSRTHEHQHIENNFRDLMGPNIDIESLEDPNASRLYADSTDYFQTPEGDQESLANKRKFLSAEPMKNAPSSSTNTYSIQDQSRIRATKLTQGYDSKFDWALQLQNKAPRLSGPLYDPIPVTNYYPYESAAAATRCLENPGTLPIEFQQLSVNATMGDSRVRNCGQFNEANTHSSSFENAFYEPREPPFLNGNYMQEYGENDDWKPSAALAGPFPQLDDQFGTQNREAPDDSIFGPGYLDRGSKRPGNRNYSASKPTIGPRMHQKRHNHIEIFRNYFKDD